MKSFRKHLEEKREVDPKSGFEYHINPSNEELKGLVKRHSIGDFEWTMRGLYDPEAGDFYFWDSRHMIHYDFFRNILKKISPVQISDLVIMGVYEDRVIEIKTFADNQHPFKSMDIIKDTYPSFLINDPELDDGDLEFYESL